MLGGMEILPLLIALLALLVGLAFGAVIGALWARTRHVDELVDQAELLQGLDRLGDQLHHLDRARVGMERALAEQVAGVRRQAEALGHETRSLATALRRPQVRGRWGELHLRRAVELAGLVDRCDFTEQVRLDDGAQRPDLVVHLAGGKQVIVDAKVPLDAHLDATAADDPAEREHHLRRHAAQLRAHVDGLASKAYWRSLAETPEFVVLFVPAESFLADALAADPALIDYAAGKQVVLATPTTLIALLRTVAHGWSHEALADQAREIHRLGRELHARLATLSGHLDTVGRSLNRAVESYNRAMASLDTRVLVAARRFSELSVTDDDLPAPRPVELRAVERLPAPTRRAAHDDEGGDPTVAL